MNDGQLIKRETSLRRVGAQGRETLKISPFEAFVSTSKNPTMRFATPHTEVSNWSDAIEELKRLPSGLGRRARPEYFHELYLTLAVALETAGFRRDSAAPVMTLTRDALASPSVRTEGTYKRSVADEPERLRAFLEQDLLGSTQLVVNIDSRFRFESAVFERRRERELSVSEDFWRESLDIAEARVTEYKALVERFTL